MSLDPPIVSSELDDEQNKLSHWYLFFSLQIKKKHIFGILFYAKNNMLIPCQTR